MSNMVDTPAVADLRLRAQKRGVAGYGAMSAAELQAALDSFEETKSSASSVPALVEGVDVPAPDDAPLADEDEQAAEPPVGVVVERDAGTGELFVTEPHGSRREVTSGESAAFAEAEAAAPGTTAVRVIDGAPEVDDEQLGDGVNTLTGADLEAPLSEFDETAAEAEDGPDEEPAKDE